jgi:hypothetical protein
VSLRCARLSGAVVAMKIGATPTGSMITVKVTNVVPTMFQSTRGRPYAPGRSANGLMGIRFAQAACLSAVISS